jgi:hypothetical protein
MSKAWACRKPDDLRALLKSDLTDHANRQVLADALQDVGRDNEARMLRAGKVPPTIDPRRYYVFYPRDFANEYDVLVVRRSWEGRFLRAYPDADRITRPQALRFGLSLPRQARRDSEQWYGGFAGGASDPRRGGREAALRCAEEETLRMVEEKEMVPDWKEELDARQW